MRMSKRLREELEGVLESLLADRPYCSPDAESKLVHLLGYAVSQGGERVPIEAWFDPNRRVIDQEKEES